MTFLATFLDLIPMAIGMGRGSEANVPLARAVVGGLLTSTCLTLFVRADHVHAVDPRQAVPRARSRCDTGGRKLAKSPAELTIESPRAQRTAEGSEAMRTQAMRTQAMNHMALQLGFVFSVSSVTRWLEDGCGCRTTNTGHGARRNVCSAMLPASSRAKPVRPWVHMTIKSILFSSANRSICSAGSPSTTKCSTGIEKPAGGTTCWTSDMSRWR